MALPIDPLAHHFADLGRAVPLAQFGEQSAPLDAGKLPIVAGEDQLVPPKPSPRPAIHQ